MNGFIDTKFYEKYIKEIPIEEKIRGRVRGECHYMDKADIYEWITQDEIEINNLQSKIDKAIERIKYEEMFDDDNHHLRNFKEELLDILKESGTNE